MHHLPGLFIATQCCTVPHAIIFYKENTKTSQKYEVFSWRKCLAAGKGTVGAFGTRSGSLVLLEKHIVWMFLLNNLQWNSSYWHYITFMFQKIQLTGKRHLQDGGLLGQPKHSLGYRNRSAGKLSPGTRRMKETGTASTDLSQANHVWPTRWPPVMSWVARWMRGEHWVSFTLTLAKLSSVLHTLQGRADTQRKHHGHRKWVNRSHMKLMWKVLHLGHNSLMNHTGWALTTWTAAPMKRTWGCGRWQVEDETVVCPCSNKS